MNIISIIIISVVNIRDKKALGYIKYLGKNIIKLFIILNKKSIFFHL